MDMGRRGRVQRQNNVRHTQYHILLNQKYIMHSLRWINTCKDNARLMNGTFCFSLIYVFTPTHGKPTDFYHEVYMCKSEICNPLEWYEAIPCRSWTPVLQGMNLNDWFHTLCSLAQASHKRIPRAWVHLGRDSIYICATEIKGHQHYTILFCKSTVSLHITLCVKHSVIKQSSCCFIMHHKMPWPYNFGSTNQNYLPFVYGLMGTANDDDQRGHRRVTSRL